MQAIALLIDDRIFDLQRREMSMVELLSFAGSRHCQR